MGTAAQFDDWGKRHVECLFSDPTARAAWYAEKRIGFIEYKIERQREKLARLEDELAAAKAELEAINAGDAEPVNTDDSLGGYAKDLQRAYQEENQHGLEGEKRLLTAILEKSGFARHGWHVGEIKVSDWSEEIRIWRSRTTPRPRNSAKGILKALHIGIAAHNETQAAGSSSSECKEAAYAAYIDAVRDDGTVRKFTPMPILAAFDAAEQARNRAIREALPPHEVRQRAADAFDAVMEGLEAGPPSTGPPT